MTELSTESELLKQLRRGDENAFEHIFKMHFTGLCLFAEHFLKDTQVAENIVEDLFCDLWENFHKISVNVSLRGYLYKSVFNRCMKYIRHRNIEQKYQAEQQYYLVNEISSKATSDTECPVVNLVTKELEYKISSAVEALPPQCKKIFQLNRFKNLSYTEIAEELSISVNTVKTQMARALNKLRIELKDYLVLLATIFLSIQ